MFNIGSYIFKKPLFLAPMAGLTDFPFRQLCRQLGAELATSEMLTSDITLWNSEKSRTRLPQANEQAPRIIQLAGSDPTKMAHAAQILQQKGAQIIDINMGCPAKKVCKKAAGSALLSHPKKVENIIKAVTSSVDIPVTLKIRTGTSEYNKNALKIGAIAEKNNIAALFIHGRNRAQKFLKHAEFETCRLLKQQSNPNFPIIANGDIQNVEDAQFVLDYTHADGIMIGRAALGQPWIFSELNQGLTKPINTLPYKKNSLFLNQKNHINDLHQLNKSNSYLFKQKSMLNSPPFSFEIKIKIISTHIQAIHDYYPQQRAIAFSRRHIVYYLDRLSSDYSFFDLSHTFKVVRIEPLRIRNDQNIYKRARLDVLQATNCNSQKVALTKILALLANLSLPSSPLNPKQQVAQT